MESHERKAVLSAAKLKTALGDLTIAVQSARKSQEDTSELRKRLSAQASLESSEHDECQSLHARQSIMSLNESRMMDDESREQERLQNECIQLQRKIDKLNRDQRIVEERMNHDLKASKCEIGSGRR